MNATSMETEPVREQGEDEAGSAMSGRAAGRSRLMLAGTISGIVALTLAGLWIQRAPIAENLFARELAVRDIRMSYRVKSIGLRTQRIENIVLGDPRAPDLTARWVEVDIGFGLFEPHVVAVRADGVRIRGEWRDGRLALGELDRFSAGDGASSPLLPDIGLALSDARATIATGFGELKLSMAGSGNLRNGFSGDLNAAMGQARVQDCTAHDVRADVAVRIVRGAPQIAGPMQSAALTCPQWDAALIAPVLTLAARFDNGMENWDADASFVMRETHGVGVAFARPGGDVALAMRGGRLTGRGELRARSLAGAGIGAGAMRLNGSFAQTSGAATPTGRALLTLADLAPADRRSVRRLASRAAGTPFAPLAAKLGRAVEDAARSNRLTVAAALIGPAADRQIIVRSATLQSASGLEARLLGGGSVAMNLDRGGWTLDGAVRIGGGGFPGLVARSVDMRDGDISAVLAMAPYAAGGARLALTPLTFRRNANGTLRARGVVEIDGPLADGAVSGVRLPLELDMAANGDVRLNPRCVDARWRAVRVASLHVGQGAVALCPQGGAMLRIADGRTDGGIRTGPVALAGSVGSSRLAFDAAQLRFGLGSGRFAGQAVAVRIGAGPDPVMLSARRLTGSISGEAIAGDFAGGAARIGSVPFDMTDLAGRWAMRGETLSVDGAMRVADTEAEARFNPLIVPDVRLTLADNRIRASGSLRHPEKGGAFARVDVVHDLSSGEGAADIAVDRLVFSDALQPDDLTPLTLGVVANVMGKVAGTAAIGWSARGVTGSVGSFGTEAMDLAAAFGPVTGMATSVRFTDLLALESAPGQRVTVRSVNPGIEVRDGDVRYQLRRDQKLAIEGGEWPFAGGTLSLLPTMIDFDAEQARHLTFRVIALDAGAFINTLDLENISATGTYDGLLPMIFDADGGRIEGGILVARQQGNDPLIVTDARTLTVPCDRNRQAGTLSYVGSVSNADMNMFGKLAFDALKHLRYKCLTILLDGAIDGEFVSRIAINGVNQGSPEAAQSMLTRPFLGLPFIFNVRVEAPFRGLLNSYQSFTDPTTLIRNSLSQPFQSVLDSGAGVQPAESGDLR